MTDKVNEALSAIMDGEARDLETRRLLDEIARDDALRDTWDRFHLARSAIAGDPLDTTDGAAAIKRLWNAVDAGEGDSGTIEALPRRRPVGLGTAAAILGIAAAAVLAVWLYPVQDSGVERPPADSVARAVSSETLPAEHAAWDALSSEDRARAQAYLLQHLRRHSMANRAHPIPIAKLATYRPQPQPDRNE